MLVFHFNVYGFDRSTFRDFNPIIPCKNDVPTSLRHSAARYILKNALMEVTNIVIVRFISLAENLILDDFFPTILIDRFIENQLYRVNDIAIEPSQIKGS